jgi:hypothetical protein
MAANYWTEQYDFVFEHSSGNLVYDWQSDLFLDREGNEINPNTIPFEIMDALRKKIEEIEKEL